MVIRIWYWRRLYLSLHYFLCPGRSFLGKREKWLQSTSELTMEPLCCWAMFPIWWATNPYVQPFDCRRDLLRRSVSFPPSWDSNTNHCSIIRWKIPSPWWPLPVHSHIKRMTPCPNFSQRRPAQASAHSKTWKNWWKRVRFSNRFSRYPSDETAP